MGVVSNVPCLESAGEDYVGGDERPLRPHCADMRCGGLGDACRPNPLL